jgi:hypothetical protein
VTVKDRDLHEIDKYTYFRISVLLETKKADQWLHNSWHLHDMQHVRTSYPEPKPNIDVTETWRFKQDNVSSINTTIKPKIAMSEQM